MSSRAVLHRRMCYELQVAYRSMWPGVGDGKVVDWMEHVSDEQYSAQEARQQ